MKPGRFARLRSYYNASFYEGKMLRYLIEDSEGRSVYCDQCGNIANGVMTIQRKSGDFNIPLCKFHFAEIFPDQEVLPATQNYYYLKLKPIK